MKFTVNKQDFQNGIKSVSGALSEKATVKELGYVKADISDNVLYLTGYDLEMGIKTQIPVESDGEAHFLFDKKIAELLAKLDNGEIECKVEGEEITIKQGKSRNKRAIIPPDNYPILPNIEGKEIEFEISQNELKEMIDTTVFAAAVVANKPILMGELFEIENGNFNLVAIDGYRLAIRKNEISSDINAKFVVPAKALRELSKLITADDKLKIVKTSKHALFIFNGIMIFSRLLEGKFHNYKGTIPDSYKTSIIANTRQLVNTLDRCSLIISEKSKAPVRFSCESEKINITCKSMLGNVDDEIEVDFSGDIIEIGFNCRFIADALKNCTSDKVKISFNSPTSPAVITALDGDKYTYLVLPVRLKD